MIFETHELRLEQPKDRYPLRSMVWMDDTLVDWVGGGASYKLDGTYQSSRVIYTYRFDAAIVSPSLDFAVIYERYGAKALLLRHGKIVRELNRSYYCADAYEYPIAFLRLPNKEEMVVHCPNEYNQLEIDNAATGQRLTQAGSRKPTDYFFSRLVGSPSGAYLSSAGWIWHPLDMVKVFDVSNALLNPAHLDGDGIELGFAGEVGPACFGQADTLVVNDTMDFDADPAVGKTKLRCFDLPTRQILSDVTPSAQIGEMMAVGKHHIVNFHEHPKLISLETGAIEHEWPHLSTGNRIRAFQIKL